MPVPPAEENDNLTSTEEPKLQFSTVECLMLAFHQLGRKCPGFLADEANAERLKDFKLRYSGTYAIQHLSFPVS
jgi:hypothetical protein